MRVIRSEAELSQLLARPGYRVAEQFGGGQVNTDQSMPDAATRKDADEVAMPEKPKPLPSRLHEVGHCEKPLTSGTTKYRAVRTNGYASKKEARRAAELLVLQSQGQISNLREQVRFILVPAHRDASGRLIERQAAYVADFTYHDHSGHVVEDCKGMRTSEYVLKRKLMLMVHGIRVRET